MKKLYTILFTFMFIAVSAVTSFAKDTISANELLDIVAKAKDKQVVLISFYASWCPPCREEIPSLIEIRNKYKEEDLRLIAINLDDDVQTMHDFDKKSGINYETYHDNGSVQQFFMVQGIPFTVIYGKSGNAILATTGLLPKEDLLNAIEYGAKN